jgi:hypothetical protein
VSRDFESIARDVRHGYTIGYEPPDASKESAFRRVRVDARSPNGRPLVTRTRTGYLAGDADGRIHAR